MRIWCRRNFRVIWHGFIMWFPKFLTLWLWLLGINHHGFTSNGYNDIIKTLFPNSNGGWSWGPEPFCWSTSQGVARQVPRWVSPNLISVPSVKVFKWQVKRVVVFCAVSLDTLPLLYFFKHSFSIACTYYVYVFWFCIVISYNCASIQHFGMVVFKRPCALQR